MSAVITRPEFSLSQPLNAGTLDHYIQSVSQLPLLTEQEEQELGAQLRDKSDVMAAQKLILHNLRFVVHVARSYMGYGLQLADLIQEGNVGLMKAVKRFDPDRGVRLVGFAVHWIKAEIHDYVIRNWRIVKVATTKAQRKLFFNLRKNKNHLGWFSAAEASAVADDLGVSTKDVHEMESRLSGRDVSLLGDSDDDEDAWRAPVAHLEALDSDPADNVANHEVAVDSQRRLGMALAKLDDRSRDIVQRRWLDDAKSTLQELADEYGVSAERIRQLEKATLKKLSVSIGPIGG